MESNEGRFPVSLGSKQGRFRGAFLSHPSQGDCTKSSNVRGLGKPPCTATGIFLSLRAHARPSPYPPNPCSPPHFAVTSLLFLYLATSTTNDTAPNLSNQQSPPLEKVRSQKQSAMTAPRFPILPLLLAFAGAAPLLRAAELARGDSAQDLVRATVDAATRDAVESLLEEIGRLSLSGRVSVGKLLRDTSSFDELRKTLRQSEQVGGPRWTDDRTCQVQLQVSGTRIATALSRIAAANPDRSPLSPD